MFNVRYDLKFFWQHIVSMSRLAHKWFERLLFRKLVRRTFKDVMFKKLIPGSLMRYVALPHVGFSCNSHHWVSATNIFIWFYFFLENFKCLWVQIFFFCEMQRWITKRERKQNGTEMTKPTIFSFLCVIYIHGCVLKKCMSFLTRMNITDISFTMRPCHLKWFSWRNAESHKECN